MKTEIDGEVGVSCSGFVAHQDGKLIASAKTFGGLADKKSVKRLLGRGSLAIRHVVPEGTVRIY